MTTFIDSTPGTGKTWTVPAGVTALTAIHLWGGGAGGQNSAGPLYDGGRGGGGGGHVYSNTKSVSPGDVITYDVGGGGGHDTVGEATTMNGTGLLADGGGTFSGSPTNTWDGGGAHGGSTNNPGGTGVVKPSGIGGDGGGGGGAGGTGTAGDGNPGSSPGGGGAGSAATVGGQGGAGANGLIQWDYAGGSGANKDAIWFGMSF